MTPLDERLLRTLRPAARWIVERRWDVRPHGASRVPGRGPVIVVANHLGWLDGPVLVITAPRRLHALTKDELFVGVGGHVLRGAGQIPLRQNGVDAGALRAARGALRAGQAVLVFPEGTRGDGLVQHTKAGAAWLALSTGAPVVPVALIGTRDRGGGAESRPARGSRLDVVYGEPLRLPRRWGLLDAGTIEDADRQLREHLAEHVAQSVTSLGRDLPGPLPDEEIDRA